MKWFSLQKNNHYLYHPLLLLCANLENQLQSTNNSLLGMISNFATGSLSSLFYHCYQIWYKDCLKYENSLRLLGTPFVPPPPHHHHWHYFDITKLPYQKQYSRHVKKASESESFIDVLISGFMMEFHHFLNEYDGILSFCQLAAILWWVPIIW